MGRLRFCITSFVIGAATIGCDRSVTTAPLPSSTLDAQVVGELRAAGYLGPVIVAERTPQDGRGTGRTTRRLFLPKSGLTALVYANSARLQTVGATALEVTSPDLIDPDHNSLPADLGAIVNPSVLNGRAPVQSLVSYRFSFYSYDPAVDDWYIIQSGTIDRTYIRARDSSSGHWHGSVDTNQVHIASRVGTLQPATGSISAGIWQTQWRVPEVSNEVSFAIQVTEIDGPNNGQQDWFYSFQNDADRFTGLQRLPENAARYTRVGGTGTHPAAFNDWGTADIITRIQNVANSYFNKTADLTRVNDIALFYGGRFDVGRTSGSPAAFSACGDFSVATCWQFSHFEHRFGTEVDINPEKRTDPRARAKFYALLRAEFITVFVEGDHYHARGAGSPYPR